VKDNTGKALTIIMCTMKAVSQLCVLLAIAFIVYGIIRGFNSPKTIVILISLATFIAFQIIYRLIKYRLIKSKYLYGK